MAIIKCPECGQDISDTAKVCIHCGYQLQKNENKDQLKEHCQKVRNFCKKNIRFFVIIIAALTIVISIWQIFLPNLFISTSQLREKGNYEAVYKRTKNTFDREEVVWESRIADICNDVVDSLKNPTSFVLLEAAYTDNGEILLNVQAHNSYGNNVCNYWYYTWNEDTQRATYKDTLTDFDQEEYYSWMSVDERREIAESNLNKAKIQLSLALGLYNIVPKEYVDNINKLYASGKLNDINPIQIRVIPTATPNTIDKEVGEFDVVEEVPEPTPEPAPIPE